MRRRILTSILLVIAATVLTLGVPLSVVSWKLVADLVHQELAGQLERISQSLSAQAAAGEDPNLNRLAFMVPADGRLVIKTPGLIDQTVGERISGQVISEKLVIAGGGELRLSIPAASVRSEQMEVLGLVGLAVLLSVAVGAVIAILTARRLATPLTELARRAARLGAGDFRESTKRYDVAELDRVLEVLDSSATDIAALISRERDLASDISHQLRTRLTGLRLRLEELSYHDDPAVVDEVRAALDQTDRLVTVVDDLLANARSRRAAGATTLHLADELDEVAAEWRQAFEGAKRQLVVRCPKRVTVRATGVRLREAIGVLVDNALHHGDGTVRISVRTGSPMVVVEVSDEGPGVTAALVGHIFERGVSTASSTGIGLGLARAFIEADGGRLELRRARPPIFGIFLVAAAADTDDAAAGEAADAASDGESGLKSTTVDYRGDGEVPSAGSAVAGSAGADSSAADSVMDGESKPAGSTANS